MGAVVRSYIQGRCRIGNSEQRKPVVSQAVPWLTLSVQSSESVWWPVDNRGERVSSEASQLTEAPGLQVQDL